MPSSIVYNTAVRFTFPAMTSNVCAQNLQRKDKTTMATYQITIPDSVEWHEETRDFPYRRLKAKLSIYTLYLDLIDPEDDEVVDEDDDRRSVLKWVPTIYDDIIDADIYTSFDGRWEEDDLETAKEEILEEALNQLHAYLVDDFGAVEISDDSIDTESGIDSLDLEN